MAWTWEFRRKALVGAGYLVQVALDGAQAYEHLGSDLDVGGSVGHKLCPARFLRRQVTTGVRGPAGLWVVTGYGVTLADAGPHMWPYVLRWAYG